jgi:Protein of unknown function (DUF4446)
VLLSIVLVFALIALVVQHARLTSLEVRLLRLTRGSDDGNLEDVLESHLDAVARVVDDVDALAAQATVLDARSQRALQRIGFVRFNPFEDTGGNQSFALAILDGRADGIVISSLHTRAATRIYAKTLSGGRSEGALSAEESQAVELARSTSGGRTVDGTIDVRPADAPPAAGAVPAPSRTGSTAPAPTGSASVANAAPAPAVAQGPMGVDNAR